MSIKSTIEALIARAEANSDTQYQTNWQQDAVWALNDYYSENDISEFIYELASDEWDDVVYYQLRNRGWLGIKIFLAGIENTAEWAKIDGYGNAVSVDYKLLDLLKEAREGY